MVSAERLIVVVQIRLGDETSAQIPIKYVKGGSWTSMRKGEKANRRIRSGVTCWIF
jgi:hypothetical protein